MNNNYHIFVIITTIIVYIFLSSRKKNDDDDEDKSSIMYLLYVPAVLYGGYYFYYNPYNTKPSALTSHSDMYISLAPISQPYIDKPIYYSDDLLSDPYPTSSNSTF